MPYAHFRFYAQLNDFLPPARRVDGFTYEFEHTSSIKNMIEALGVPHTEVHLILVNSEPVDFSYLVQDEDRISVYPAFRSIDVSSVNGANPRLPVVVKFILDIHLGRLVAYLRMLGFDTLYPEDYRDEELARLANVEQRILLTRDIGLLKRSAVTYGYFVRETDPEQQLIEVLKGFDLAAQTTPFHRCLHCNGLLAPVDKAEIIDQLPANTRQYYDEFRRCQSCHKIYWKGSHYQRMQRLIERVLQEDAQNL